MECNIIGAGRLGKNLALSLSAMGLISINSICNKSLTSAQSACVEIGTGTAVENLEQLPKTDITWITCNDDAIELIAKKLSQHAILKPKSLVIHCSGALNSSVLSSLKSQGCSIASIHPLKAFKTGYLSMDAFHNVDCIVEGDDEACDWIKQTFPLLGANIIEIKPQTKASYHAAACIASNYLITLAACSEELLQQSGISNEQSRKMIVHLMQGNLNNLKDTLNVSESLTGPLMRGDDHTLSKHLQAIDNPLTKALYKTVGLATIPLTDLDEHKKKIIKKILTD